MPRQKPISAEEVFDPKAFDSIETTVDITNGGTGTPFKPDPPAQITELHDVGLIIEAAANGCAEGHHLILKIKSKVCVTATAKVVRVQHQGPVDRISLAFVQYDEKEWQEFCESFASRQNEILDFFKAAKGY